MAPKNVLNYLSANWILNGSLDAKQIFRQFCSKAQVFTINGFRGGIFPLSFTIINYKLTRLPFKFAIKINKFSEVFLNL